MGSTSTETEHSINSCANCRKDATQVCNSCHHAPDIHGGEVDPVWYCSPGCQIADRSEHESACQKAQDRRALYRAGATAQLAFYRYLEKFPDGNSRKVEKKGEDDFFVYKDHPNEDNVAALPFSWEACDSEEDRMTVLTLVKCTASTGFTHVLMDIMLPGESRRPRGGAVLFLESLIQA